MQKTLETYKAGVAQVPDKAPETQPEQTKGITIEKYLYNMRCKFLDFDTADERFLTESFGKLGITHVTDEGFKPIHDHMVGILKNRHYSYR